jgi:hypothetical protein
MQLLCQITNPHNNNSHKIVQVQALDVRNLARARKYVLDDGSEVYLIINSDLVHSTHWVTLLQTQMNISTLHELDAIVVGVFNDCHVDVNTTFAQEMKDAINTTQGIDCTQHNGPTVQDVAAVYAGPILYVSMFATYRSKHYQMELASIPQIQQHYSGTPPRTNIHGMEARQYIKDYQLPECGSAQRETISDCFPDEETLRRYHHRCVGPYGGHPDLIAWDVLEFLYQHAK